LHPEQNWAKVIEAFNEQLLPEAIRDLNQGIASHQIARLSSERLPENERNLTDTRTRIGVLLEYSLGLCLDERLGRLLGRRYRLGFVVTNKFPDLVLRGPVYQPLVRLEVKCVQTAAEEKSANL